MYPPNIQNFIRIFSKLPGIGPKTSERIAFYILSQSEDFSNKIAESIKAIKKETKKCSECGNIGLSDPCNICKDENRDKSKICVVESALDIYAIEELNSYKGLYHCLDGLISPLHGVTPDKINIKKLINKIKEKEIKELIFALSATPEGDLTIFYIKDLLKDINIKITALARGIPVGTGLQYASSKSLLEALKGREEVK